MNAIGIAGAAGASLLALTATSHAQPYVGEMRTVAFDYCPAGWLEASGQLLPIPEFETLFQLIGTSYGGDGQSTFALPDLRGRALIHVGAGFGLAEQGPRVRVSDGRANACARA